MSPRARTAEEESAARDRLIEAGRERFARYGLQKVSIHELVGDARMSKGSFYKLFESKEHLFIEIKEIVEEEIFVDFKAALDAKGDDPHAVLKEFFLYPQRNLSSRPFYREAFRPGVMELVADRVGLEAAAGRDVPLVVIRTWVDQWWAEGVIPRTLTAEHLVGLATIFGAALRVKDFFRTDYDETIELAAECIVIGLLSQR